LPVGGGAAVITGGSSGIGAAIARKLALSGRRCVLLARGVERLEAVAGEIGGEYEICDVAEREEVERAAARVLDRHPRIELLVNSAGIPGRVGFLTGAPERIERVLAINYLGSVWTLRAFLPGLEAGAPSDVVNIVSVAGLVATPASGPYSAAKHAQLAFSRSVAVELSLRRIRVHTVNPGLVETEGFPQRDVLATPGLGRVVLQPEAVAKHVVEMIERGRRESVVPRWYRVAAIAQALSPSLVDFALRRVYYRKGTV
jgi:short-subunit dehydrogenase